MNGVFCALDFVLFYVFWELVLVPMYFLIAVWGGARREYAAIKFFLYTLFGSVFMLVGILALYLHPAGGTFDMLELATKGFPPNFQWWVFAAFFLGFAVKVPIWPLHTWLPDAHVEAPTAASVLLAGVLLKMGTYGFIRVSMPILPHAFKQWAPYIAILAAISIVYGAAVAFAQTDLKKLVAYSSVSHMGFVMLGIAAGTVAGLDGAVAVMFSHGVVTGMLFLLVGMVYERTHTRQIAEVSGLAVQMPVAAGMLAFASFASLGLPGLSGFVGEFLSLLGAWQSDLSRAVIVVSAFGVLARGGLHALDGAARRSRHALGGGQGPARPHAARDRHARAARRADRGRRRVVGQPAALRRPRRARAARRHGDPSVTGYWQLLPEAVVLAAALVALFGEFLPGRDRSTAYVGVAACAAGGRARRVGRHRHAALGRDARVRQPLAVRARGGRAAHGRLAPVGRGPRHG